ncbi:MAG: sugar-binding domain-containing protein [Christensenellales bacterium]
MPITDDVNLIYKVAVKFYLEGKSQVEIARSENLSRATICRLLRAAREMDMVHIDVTMPKAPPPSPRVAEELAKALGLSEVIVAPAAPGDTNEETLLRSTVAAAAAHMPRLIADSYMVGVGWGRSIYGTALQLPNTKGPKKLFIPLVNNFAYTVPALQTSVIMSYFGERFNSNCYYLNISHQPRKKGERTEAELENIRQLTVFWNALDAAIFSLSSPEQLLNSEVYSALWQNGLDAGPDEQSMRFECMGQVYCEDGSYVGVNKNYDLIALDLKRLRNIKKSICIGSGLKKVKSLIYAARLGFYNVLITDGVTAAAMLKEV